MTEEIEQNLPKEEIPVIGEKLRAAREARKLSQQDIAEKLRLKPSIIEALESEQYEKIAGPTFVRGYLRSYAAQVGLDADEMVSNYNRIVGEEGPHPSMKVPAIGKRKSTIAWKSYIFYLVLGLVILGGAAWWFSQTREESVQETTTATESTDNGITAQTEPQPGFALPDTPETPTPTEPAQSGREESPQEPQESNVPEPEPAEPARQDVVPAEPETVTQVPQGAEDTLTLRFTGDSWVEVRDRKDNRLLYQLGKNGQEHTVSGDAPFNVLLGNSPVVSVEFNGQPYDQTPQTRGKVARFKLGS